MKLYTFDPAPNPRRLGLFLAFKGITLPTQQIDLRSGEQLGAAFMAINPRCTVPVLKLDDGTTLCDAIAIAWYLESRFPQRPLLGTDPLSQARILSWDTFIFTDGLMPVAEALRNRSPGFRDRALPGAEAVAQIPELEPRGRQRLQAFWRHLDEHLQTHEYLVGNGVTLADIDAFVLVEFAGWIKEAIPESRTAVRAWHRRVTEDLAGAKADRPAPSG